MEGDYEQNQIRSVDFGQIFEQSRRLTAHMVSRALPSLERDLTQIDAQTRKLSSKSARVADTAYARGEKGVGDMEGVVSGAPAAGVSDERTAYLLARRGFDPQRVAATLNRISPALAALDAAAASDAMLATHDSDIEACIRAAHETIVSNAIEESRIQTMRDCDDRFDRAVQRDWERAKERIFQELGQHRQQHHRHAAAATTPSAMALLGPGAISAVASPGGIGLSAVVGRSPVGGMVTAHSGGASMQILVRNRHYAAVIDTLNRHRIEKRPFELIHAFQAVAVKMDIDRSDVGHKQLIKCWQLLCLILEEQPGDTVIPEPMYAHALPHVAGRQQSRFPQIKELQYQRQYQSLSLGAGMADEAIRFRKRVISGGLRFLEETYYNHIVESQARLQVQVPGENPGLAGPAQRIQQYVTLKFLKHGSWGNIGLEIIEGRAYWAELYFLFRCGFRNEALQLAQTLAMLLQQQHRDQHESSKFFAVFREYLSSEGGRLSPAMRNELLDEWNTRVRSSIMPTAMPGEYGGVGGPMQQPRGDPFKGTLYKIVGRCEMTVKTVKNEHVLPTIEDYMWMQLKLIQEDVRVEDNLQDRYTLRDMARNMLRFGPNHFSPQGRAPHVYFLVLVLCGEFERAVAHLYSNDQYSVDAIHYAIALAYYGTLRIPDAPPTLSSDGMMAGLDLLTIRPADSTAAVPSSVAFAGYELAYFHFERMVHGYARQFFVTDPVEALNYEALSAIYGGEPGPLTGRDSVMTEAGDDGSRAVVASGAALTGTASADAADRQLRERSARAYTESTHVHLRELLLESGNSPRLMGTSRPDGTRVQGEIERLAALLYLTGSPTAFVDRIIRPAAEEADSRGRLAEAVQLFDRAEEYDTVVRLLCRQLSESLANHRTSSIADMSDPLFPPTIPAAVAPGSESGLLPGAFVSSPNSSAKSAFSGFSPVKPGSGGPASGAFTPGPSSVQQQQPISAASELNSITAKAMEVLEHYRSIPTIATKISSSSNHTCDLLITLHRFTREAEGQRSDDVALATLAQAGIVPLEPDMLTVTRMAENFRLLDETVARCVPNVLLTAMATITTSFRAIKDARFAADAARVARMTELRSMARAIILFAGAIQYRIPIDVRRNLNKLDVMMG